jgi:hypothetical protein
MKIHYLALLFLTGIPGASAIELSDEEAMRIGRLLWKNECAGTIEGLTSWNKGESFASLGIGHFIWYPPGQEGPFEESFPKLVAYLQDHGVDCPDWIIPPADCPWKTLPEFEGARQSSRMKELRGFLAETIGLQARYAARRLKQALPKILESIPENQRTDINRKFHAVAAHPHGHYVLLDYVNFKGEGTNEQERYHGQGWGLLQVLENMPETKSSEEALDAFSQSAIDMLTLRIKNSPPARGEKRWLKGWTNRCLTYRAP